MVLLIQLWNTKNNDRTQFEKNIHTGLHWLFGSPNTSVSTGPRERREREFQCSNSHSEHKYTVHL